MIKRSFVLQAINGILWLILNFRDFFISWGKWGGLIQLLRLKTAFKRKTG
ncbi:Hypothetical protein HPV225_1378 [Helicobacter pylori v225d]|nr:Hypothetical protein HPV225_1378 [Helicobacter pylori v225d]